METNLEKEMEKMYIELQIITQQMKQLQKQILLLNNQLVELTLLYHSLKEFKDIKEGANILVAVGNGIFANAELKNNQELIVNVGANVAVKKDVDSTRQLILQQADEIKNVQQQMNAELKNLYEQANSIEWEINKLSKTA